VTPLPGALGGTEFVGWRLDRAKYAATWDSGEGAFQVGGRWNNEGVRVVYAAIDPATALIEVAAHTGFRVLDTQPHVLTRFRIETSADIHIIEPSDVPNPNWLRPGIPSAGQKAFGDDLLTKHDFILVPSITSTHSWNVIFDPARTGGLHALIEQEAFALDPRLHPAKPV
jgi:RES domain-containing protein